MTLGIALLLKGSSADLSATLHAIELAKRTTGVVHAVLMEQGGLSKGNDLGEEVKNDTQSLAGQFITLASWLGGVKGVAMHLHRLDSMADELLVPFLCEYHIFCLIVGAENQRSLKRKTAWIARLRHLLAEKEDCFAPCLWSKIIPPGGDLELAHIIDQFPGGISNASVIRIVADNLQNGLRRLEHNKKF